MIFLRCSIMIVMSVLKGFSKKGIYPSRCLIIWDMWKVSPCSWYRTDSWLWSRHCRELWYRMHFGLYSQELWELCWLYRGGYRQIRLFLQRISVRRPSRIVKTRFWIIYSQSNSLVMLGGTSIRGLQRLQCYWPRCGNYRHYCHECILTVILHHYAAERNQAGRSSRCPNHPT